VIDLTPVRFLLVTFAGWLNHRQEEAVACLIKVYVNIQTRRAMVLPQFLANQRKVTLEYECRPQ
jgi:hypothetical protein